MLPLHTTLSYYKRDDIRFEILKQCRGKEVGVKFGEGFGKRPDILLYESDVLAFAQKKATSFHISEETWTNPMQLRTGLRRKELDELRVGWDLILDIDFPHWEATKIITYALIEQLREENIPDQAISVKFSGNKGFHIAVPFEAFPYSFTLLDGEEKETANLFPDEVKSVLEYIVHQVDGFHNNFALSKKLINKLGFETMSDSIIAIDEKTGEKIAEFHDQNEFVCPNCAWRKKSEEEYVNCENCKTLLSPTQRRTTTQIIKKIDLGVDAMLVSSRHMYRLVYSLHEKSGLVSIPIHIDNVLDFDKEAAKPQNVTTKIPFLNRAVPQGCAAGLLQKALTYAAENYVERDFSQVEWEGDAAPEEAFPPAILKMLAGLRDGRQRALFVLTNFLASVGWSPEMIDKRLHEWNEINEEPLRETVLEGHMRYHKQRNEIILPPNFDNDMYYKDIGVLVHDELSERVKNPVQYVRMKMKQA